MPLSAYRNVYAKKDAALFAKKKERLKMLKINGINHFAISVAQLEESVSWYSRIFGFTVLDRSEIPGAGVNRKSDRNF